MGVNAKAFRQPENTNPIVKLLLAFALAGLLLLCAIYSTLAYYRLVSIAKRN